IGRGRELTVCWGTTGARGGRLACDASETSRSLDPDGCVVQRPHGRHHAQANRGASEATSRGVECAKRNATEKSCQKLCKGEVLPLDRSLLMGIFPIRLIQQTSMPTTSIPEQARSGS